MNGSLFLSSISPQNNHKNLPLFETFFHQRALLKLLTYLTMSDKKSFISSSGISLVHKSILDFPYFLNPNR